jgi:cysteinyl-tRNA synthetase
MSLGWSQRACSADSGKRIKWISRYGNSARDEPYWASPWGDGRPGWHIECSAMIRKYLGETIDVHGGGQDLIFPHHENEIAQSEAANDKPFVRYWLHNGFINVDHEKMSKSTGNFFTVRDLVSKFDYMVLRFFMLSGHYRMPINFSSDLLSAAQNGWERIKTCVGHLDFVAASAPSKAADEQANQAQQDLRASIQQFQDEFEQAMDDDLNTADALAAVFEMVRAANTAAAVPGISASSLREAAHKLREWLEVLGLNPENKQESIPEKVLSLVEERAQAKQARDFAKADEIRQEIQNLGYQVADTPQGPKVTSL